MTSVIYDETMFLELSENEMMSVDGGAMNLWQAASLVIAITGVAFTPAALIGAVGGWAVIKAALAGTSAMIALVASLT